MPLNNFVFISMFGLPFRLVHVVTLLYISPIMIAWFWNFTIAHHWHSLIVPFHTLGYKSSGVWCYLFFMALTALLMITAFFMLGAPHCTLKEGLFVY